MIVVLLLTRIFIFQVRINVQDVNDNSPTFPDDTYNIVVYDITLAGVAIHRAIAIDDDSGDFGAVTYEMSPDTNRGKTGDCFVKRLC